MVRWLIGLIIVTMLMASLAQGAETGEAERLFAEAQKRCDEGWYDKAVALWEDFLVRFQAGSQRRGHAILAQRTCLNQKEKANKEQEERFQAKMQAALRGHARKERVQKIDGFGGLKFGMAVKQADTVRQDDRLVSSSDKSCSYGGMHVCLVRNALIYGEQAEIVAQFPVSTKRLEKILVTFYRLDATTSGTCANVIEAVLPKLIELYGRQEMGRENLSMRWTSPQGGMIEWMNLCLSHDEGVVVVSYQHSEGL